MATKRLSMRQTREILRQKFVLGRSHREIAGSLGVSVGAVGMAVSRARVAGLDWLHIETLPDDGLDAQLYRRAPLPIGDRPVPDGAYLHTELRKPGVTLQLLHEEYLHHHPTTGYRYTQFCGYYNRWLGRHRLTMRQPHRAGEKFFVDYSGKKLSYTDPRDRRADSRRVVCRRHGRVQLHVRGSDAHPARPGLDRQPSARLRLLGRRARGRRV